MRPSKSLNCFSSCELRLAFFILWNNNVNRSTAKAGKVALSTWQDV